MKNPTAAPEQAVSARAEQLQFLRFLAFLNIFIAHGEVWNFFGYPASHSAAFAVSFFFMLSGLATGYSRYGRETKPTLKNIGRDMWKKIRTVYPAYFLTQVVMILFSPAPGMAASGDFAGLKEFFLGFGKALLLLQSWPGVQANSLNGVTWFLSTIFFLYLFNLPALWLMKKTRQHRFRYVFLGTAFVLLMVLTVVYCKMTEHTRMSYWQYSFPPSRLGEYLGGMLLGYAIRDFKSQPILQKIPGAVFTLLELLALGFWAWSLRRAGNYWMNHIVSWLIPNTFLLTVFTFGMGKISGIFRAKPLVWLGDISFECFLVHNLIILRYVTGHSVETMTVFYQAFSITYCLLLTVLVAAFLHQKPGGKPAVHKQQAYRCVVEKRDMR